MGTKKRYICILGALLIGILAAGCGKEQPQENPVETSENIVVGFSQIGAESDWRSANSESMREAFSEENGYELLFEDGQQKQTNQIRAIRTFIQRGVDYIVLAPVIETGWDTVLQEAKDAGIPVIIVDRRVEVADDSLYTAWVGSDFALEGEKVSEWINQFLQAKGIEEANIVNIQGTIGATAQIGRTRRLQRACEQNSNMNLLAEVSGDFTQAKGREAMESLLKEYDNINIAYCENDNEAFGAIEAITAAGKTVGSDIAAGEIMVVSFDGVNDDSMDYIYEDKITCIAECNPLQGPQVRSIIENLEAGQPVERYSYMEEKLYAHDDTVKSVVLSDETYPVTVVTKEIVEKTEES